MLSRLENNRTIDYIRMKHDAYLSELKEFLSIPSVSTLAENKDDVHRAAEWIASELTEIGFEQTTINETQRHPVVTGQWENKKSDQTVLIYGHYDVQPVDPINEWVSPPFSPTIRGENIFARGSSDMKGQLHAILKALEAWKQSNGEPPLNIKVLFEGEEEIGSPSLGSFINQNKEKLKSDFCLNTDSAIRAPDLPAIVYGLRGIAYFELTVTGPKRDLHSGSFGGAVQNPAHALCELIAGMHDSNGHVTLPSFYDKVRKLPEDEKRDVLKYGASDEEVLSETGAKELYGESGFSTAERIGARPTLEVNGLVSGFTGEGQKTVLPSKAGAKISTRLVPYQEPDDVETSLREYLKQRTPKGVSWELKRISSAFPALIKRDSKQVYAASKAFEESYGKKPVFILEGGSIPIVILLKEALGIDSVLMGFALPDGANHAPNEKLHLPSYFKGIEAYSRFLGLVS